MKGNRREGGNFNCSVCHGTLLAPPPSARKVRCPICEASTRVGFPARSGGGGGWGGGGGGVEHVRRDRLAVPVALPSASSSSSSSGRKRALICGVTYPQPKFKIHGTLNDASNFKKLLLEHFHFPDDSIVVLTEGTEPGRFPTKKNMETWLHWLVEDCRPGDSLVFYFSGHGLRQPDFDDDELDGFDETLCPSDFLTEGMITDNYINDTIVRWLTKDVTLHAIIDACHSGTVLDLEYVFDKYKGEWKDNKPPSGANKGTSGGLAICFSACADNQKASDTDAFTKNSMNGVLTTTFIEAIERNPDITYGQLLTSILEAIKRFNKRGFRFRFLNRIFHRLLLQEPQLSSSEKFDYNIKFKL